MPALNWRILSPTDKDLFAVLSNLAIGNGPAKGRFSVGRSTGMQHHVVEIDFASKERSGAVQAIESSDSYLVDAATVSLHDRHIGEWSLEVSRLGERETGLDEVRVHTQPHISAEQLLEVTGRCRAALRPFERRLELEEVLSPALAEFYNRRDDVLRRLEGAVADLGSRLAERRIEMDRELQVEREKMRSDQQAREAEAERRLREREIVLVNRENALADLQKEVDDRRATHARRALRKDLLEKLRESSKSFKLSDATARKRLPAHLAFGALALFSVGSIWTTFANALDGASVAATVRFVASAITLVFTAIFYIRWNDAWASRHASEETRLRKMELDVDRASWVVEVLLEWKEEKDGAPLPSELMQSLVEGLFRSSDRSAPDRLRHPAEDLATALISSATKAELSVGGQKLYIDKKGLNSLSKTQQGANDAE